MAQFYKRVVYELSVKPRTSPWDEDSLAYFPLVN